LVSGLREREISPLSAFQSHFHPSFRSLHAAKGAFIRAKVRLLLRTTMLPLCECCQYQCCQFPISPSLEIGTGNWQHYHIGNIIYTLMKPMVSGVCPH
ncbi:MAG: hypothetical protein IJK04_11350, partial [Kiritimatiellae bacterium]|nr:hypothetical protein [Kiritimatiellia bacterium]